MHREGALHLWLSKGPLMLLVREKFILVLIYFSREREESFKLIHQVSKLKIFFFTVSLWPRCKTIEE